VITWPFELAASFIPDIHAWVRLGRLLSSLSVRWPSAGAPVGVLPGVSGSL
jgi:hypothetical protein